VLGYIGGAGDSHTGVPTFEYVNHLQNRARANDGLIDLGAYEYSQPMINNLRLSGSNSLVSFNGQSGNQYDLEYASNLIGTAWLAAVTNVSGTNGIIEITDTNATASSQRFYRIKSAL
jgi:hypothetical protein